MESLHSFLEGLLDADIDITNDIESACIYELVQECNKDNRLSMDASCFEIKGDTLECLSDIDIDLKKSDFFGVLRKYDIKKIHQGPNPRQISKYGCIDHFRISGGGSDKITDISGFQFDLDCGGAFSCPWNCKDYTFKDLIINVLPKKQVWFHMGGSGLGFENCKFNASVEAICSKVLKFDKTTFMRGTCIKLEQDNPRVNVSSKIKRIATSISSKNSLSVLGKGLNVEGGLQIYCIGRSADFDVSIWKDVKHMPYNATRNRVKIDGHYVSASKDDHKKGIESLI